MTDSEAVGRAGRSLRSASALGVGCEDLPAALAQFVELPAPAGPLAVNLLDETLNIVGALVPLGVIRTANDLVDMTVITVADMITVVERTFGGSAVSEPGALPTESA
ncbi:Uncharacterised protein [Mycobacteroides abscessus subsp. abscessus]|uniref:hypothetical protein n=1 Tax=Mycobacteroides abscessus TaxID=36809 RepID=UPI0009CEBF22|nr:hypothetical protein [Mycobacteroides abscessus]SLI19741.1 Uncharacterised protein [Mycobacteroides abscessus subsp. abscessus]